MRPVEPERPRLRRTGLSSVALAGESAYPWGHTPCVPCGGWRGAVPPLTPTRLTARHERWTRRMGEGPRQRGRACRVARPGQLRRLDAVGFVATWVRGQAMACRPDMPPCVVQWYRYDRLGFRFRTPRACSVLETDCSESASRFATSAMLPLSS